MSLPDVETSQVFVGAGKGDKEMVKEEPVIMEEDPSKTEKPEEVPTKTAKPETPKKKAAPKKPTGIDLKLVDEKASFRYSDKPLNCKDHEGVITIAMMISEVNTKKRKGYEIRYGTAFCSPEDCYCKATGRNMAKKKLAKNTTAGIVFIQKVKPYIIDQAIFAHILSQGTHPYWARPHVKRLMMEAAIREEKAKMQRRREGFLSQQRQIAKKTRKRLFTIGEKIKGTIADVDPNNNPMAIVYSGGDYRTDPDEIVGGEEGKPLQVFGPAHSKTPVGNGKSARAEL